MSAEKIATFIVIITCIGLAIVPERFTKEKEVLLLIPLTMVMCSLLFGICWRMRDVTDDLNDAVKELRLMNKKLDIRIKQTDVQLLAREEEE